MLCEKLGKYKSLQKQCENLGNKGNIFKFQEKQPRIHFPRKHE